MNLLIDIFLSKLGLLAIFCDFGILEHLKIGKVQKLAEKCVQEIRRSQFVFCDENNPKIKICNPLQMCRWDLVTPSVS